MLILWNKVSWRITDTQQYDAVCNDTCLIKVPSSDGRSSSPNHVFSVWVSKKRISRLAHVVLWSNGLERGKPQRSNQDVYLSLSLSPSSPRMFIISLNINLFSPWYSWKIAQLVLNNNHSLITHDIVFAFDKNMKTKFIKLGVTSTI